MNVALVQNLDFVIEAFPKLRTEARPRLFVNEGGVLLTELRGLANPTSSNERRAHRTTHTRGVSYVLYIIRINPTSEHQAHVHGDHFASLGEKQIGAMAVQFCLHLATRRQQNHKAKKGTVLLHGGRAQAASCTSKSG